MADTTLSTKRVWAGFSPLYWFFYDKRPKNEEPTPFNFHRCFEKITREKKKRPGSIDQRLVSEFFGGLSAIGGLVIFSYGYFRKHKTWSVLGGLLGLGGLGFFIPGTVKDYFMKIGDRLVQLKNDRPKPEVNDKTKNQTKAPAQEENKPDSPVTAEENPKKSYPVPALRGQEEGPEDLDKYPSKSIWDQIRDLAEQCSSVLTSSAKESKIVQNPFFRKAVKLALGVDPFESLNMLEEIRKQFFGKSVAGEGGSSKDLPHSARTKNYYDILGVDRDATPDDIKRAFREKALKCHPDRNPNDPEAETKFKEASEAWEVLGDPDLKGKYDRL